MNISVIGAGSWGTALAKLLGDKGYRVNLWVYEPELAEEINRKRVNSWYLDGFELPETLKATSELSEAIEGSELLVLVTPSQVMRSVLERASEYIDSELPIVCCSKGIERGSCLLMSQVLEEVLPGHNREKFTFLSGPSFAREVAGEHPTAVVIAGWDLGVAEWVQGIFRTKFFMTFICEDVIGVEVGGALKNVLALATGMVEGLGWGNNTRAALITRGLYEMIKLGQALGASPLTFAGLAGMGDLILTCTGQLSRNRKVGFLLGQGRALDDILREMKMVAEGVYTAEAVHTLLERYDINAPICRSVYEILYQGKSLAKAVDELTSLPFREEFRSIF